MGYCDFIILCVQKLVRHQLTARHKVKITAGVFVYVPSIRNNCSKANEKWLKSSDKKSIRQSITTLL